MPFAEEKSKGPATLGTPLIPEVRRTLAWYGSSMPKTLLVSGAATVVLFLAAFVLQYFDGRHFGGLGYTTLVGFGGLASGITFFVAVIATLYRSCRGRISKKWNLLSLAILAAIIGEYALPIPSFMQGMFDAIRENFEAEELHAFASDAGASRIQWVPTSPSYNARVDELRLAHSKVFSISTLEPKITSRNGLVEIVYGGALVGHWGLAFGPECPNDKFADENCMEVYNGIWVFGY